MSDWTPLRDRQFVTCDICPYCKPRGTREQGWPGAGYKYGICDHGGNLVFMEPWKEKKIYGSGYISHKVGGCGLYEMDRLPEITAEAERTNKRREEWRQRNEISGMEKTKVEIQTNGEKTITYTSGKYPDVKIESRKRNIPHTNGVGTWSHTDYVLISTLCAPASVRLNVHVSCIA